MTAELTREGLINLLITSIAAQEGKFSDGRIIGDRAYVLGLTFVVVQALSGQKDVNQGDSVTEQAVKIPDGMFNRIVGEIDRAGSSQSATVYRTS